MSEITSQINLYDTDILAIENVYRHLQTMQRKTVVLDSFVREVKERFALAGFVVDVKTYDTNADGVYAFDIEIRDRTEGKAWDPDRMVHEVTNNVLDLPGEGGVIKSDPLLMQQAAKSKHKH